MSFPCVIWSSSAAITGSARITFWAFRTAYTSKRENKPPCCPWPLGVRGAEPVVPRAELATLLGGGGNSVEVYVCKLRAKIEKPLGRRMIHTVRGKGYRLEI